MIANLVGLNFFLILFSINDLPKAKHDSMIAALSVLKKNVKDVDASV